MIWKLDTCECVFEYNGTNSAANLVAVVNLCSDHPNHDAAVEDNVLKNVAVVQLQAALATNDPSVQADEIGWSFDGRRHLTLTPPARVKATAAHRASVAAALGAKQSRVTVV